MFKKTLMAAAITAATASTAFAGDIVVSGTAYKVGNEYLSAYTGTAGLTGNLETASIGIAYFPGIALGINNTLKFEFSGGAISANVGLQLFEIDTYAVHADDTTITVTDVTAATTTTAALPTLGSAALDAVRMRAAAVAVLNAAAAADETVNATNVATAVAAVNATADGANAAASKVLVDAAATATPLLSTVIPTGTTAVADLVDFGADANGDYEWALFKITDANLVADSVLLFNDATGTDGHSDITTTFTKATIGTGDLTVSMPEAKDDTGVSLSAPVAGAEILVTTADQFSLTATAVTDTIDVEQDRLFFSDATSDVISTAFVLDVENDATVDLFIDHTTAVIEAEITGSLAGVASVAYDETDLVGTDDDADFDDDNLVAGVGISDATIVVTVDGITNLATRTLGVSWKITPTETDTEAFYLLGASGAGANSHIWDLNGSEITFPYAPIGYSHITTNFELANSGSQEGDILLTAFTRDGVSYSGTMTQTAEVGSLVKLGEDDVYDTLGLTEGTSVSLTVTTTAPQDDIKVTGYSNIADSGGRMTLLSDAYETADCTATSVVTDDGLTTESTDVTVTCN